jgi:hypothetical protein
MTVFPKAAGLKSRAAIIPGRALGSPGMTAPGDYAATRCAAMIWSAARPVTSAM